jgi:HEAT repeat protein
VLLDETDWQVQADAAWALGRIGDRSAVIDLLRWRADGANEPLHPFVKIRVAEALLRLGNTSQVRWLVDAMYGSQSPVFEAECADNALREASGRSSGFDREGTRSAMQNTGLHWALWWERWEGFFRPPGPAPDRTDERRLRHRVAQALRDIGGSRYFDLFWARDLLARAGDLAVPDLTAALYEGDPARAGDPASHRRMNACEVFRMMVEIKVQPAPDKGVLAPHLNQVLAADADSAVRAAAARTVAVLGDRRSVGPLLALLSSDPDPSVRREAAKALGALGFADAVPALAKALPGATGILRFEIESALLRCRGRPHLEPIVEALAKGIEGDDRDLCEEALTRLEEETGRRTALPPRADARSRLLASWRHVARFHTLWRDLVTEHDSGGPGFAETAAKLRALLGPEVPPPPADPKAALRYYTDFRNLWKRLAALRMAVDRASQGPMDAAELAWLGEGLSALTGRANDLHPRTPQLDLNAAYDGWVAWAERNAPGCAGRQ